MPKFHSESLSENLKMNNIRREITDIEKLFHIQESFQTKIGVKKVLVK